MLRLFNILLVILGLVPIYSCVNKTQNEVVIVDLEQSISSSDSDSRIMPELVLDNIIETNLGDEMHSKLRIKAHSDSLFYLSDNSKIFLINRRDGKMKNVIDRQGRGPGEYLSPSGIALSDSMVVVSDVMGRRVLEYSFDLDTCHATIDVPNLGAIKRLQNGNWVVSYTSVPSDKTSKLQVYSSESEFIRESEIRPIEIESPMVRLDYLTGFGDDTYYIPAYSDTLYIVTSEVDVPLMLIDCGKYKMPLEYYSSLDLFDSHCYDYIQNIEFLISSNNLFISYHYNQHVYYTIWDLNGLLLYSYNVSYENYKSGMPFRVGNQLVYLWPSYSIGNNIYCVLSEEESIKLNQDSKNQQDLVIAVLSCR